jgi:hypothetical protein
VPDARRGNPFSIGTAAAASTATMVRAMMISISVKAGMNAE